jgi:hypothetical protein
MIEKQKKQIRSKRILKHLGKITMSLITVSLMTSPALAVDPAGEVIGSEAGRVVAKEAVNGALKLAKSKPAMTTATTIVCLACVPVAGAVASPGMCIACGILIAKTFG